MYELDLNIFNLLIIASVFVGLTFGLLLIFTRRINQTANRFLGLAALVIVLWNIWVLSLDLDIFRYFPKFYLLPLNFSLALGPSLYIYTTKMSNANYVFAKKDWLHFLPVVFELIVHLVIVKEALNSGILATDTKSFYTLIPIVQLFAIISIAIYAVLSLKKIKLYHNWLKKNYSNDHKYSLDWLYRLIVIFGIMWLLLVPYTLVDYLIFDFQLGIKDYYPMYILLSLITLWISVEVFLKPEVILLESKSKNISPNNGNSEEPDSEIIEKAAWLENQMERNLFYLDAELTLRSLADELNLHPNVLSKVINEGLQKNFSDFVNEYRANAVITRLKDPSYDKITLLGISFECGFNSKTTFNRVFKNITGKTPYDYKKSIKNF